jgi:hypothetical protein
MSEQNATVPLNRSQRDELAARLLATLRDWHEADERQDGSFADADEDLKELARELFGPDPLGDFLAPLAALLAPSAVGGAEQIRCPFCKVGWTPPAGYGMGDYESCPHCRGRFSFAKPSAGAEQPRTPTREEVEALRRKQLAADNAEHRWINIGYNYAIRDVLALYTRTPGDRG